MYLSLKRMVRLDSELRIPKKELRFIFMMRTHGLCGKQRMDDTIQSRFRMMRDVCSMRSVFRRCKKRMTDRTQKEQEKRSIPVTFENLRTYGIEAFDEQEVF